MNKCPHCNAPLLICAEYCFNCVPQVRIGAFRVADGQLAWFPASAPDGAPALATFALVDPQGGAQLEAVRVETVRAEDGQVVLRIGTSGGAGEHGELVVPLGALVARHGRERVKSEVLP